MPFKFNPFTKKLDLIDVSVIPPGTVTTLTGNSGGAVGPDGSGNINTIGTGSITVVGNPGTNTTTAQLTGLTNHSLLVGAGTATITNLGVATNGQIPIGSTGADPVLATITAGANITVTNGAGTITIAADTQALVLNYTAVVHAQSPYTVLTTDDYISADVTAGVISILLPNAPTTGRVWVVKDKIGNSLVNNITVTTVGGAVNIDGSPTYVINDDYKAISLIFNGTSYEVY